MIKFCLLFSLIAFGAWGASEKTVVENKSLTQFQKSEELPLKLNAANEPVARDRSWRVVAVLGLLLLGLGVGAFALRKLRKHETRLGSRKYLIERLSHYPLGPKMGVSLLKVGDEFVLVGVTPQGINFLSSLEKLQKQYLEENKLDRDSFQSAIREEYGKIRQSPKLEI